MHMRETFEVDTVGCKAGQLSQVLRQFLGCYSQHTRFRVIARNTCWTRDRSYIFFAMACLVCNHSRTVRVFDDVAV